MTLLLSISAGELLDAYEKSRGKNPKAAIRMVMWLMIYDEEQVSWARDFLEDVGIFSNPETKTIRINQLRQVHRWREAAEDSTGLPGRGKKGNSEEYQQALMKWKALNPRPSKEQLLAGWTPIPLTLGDNHSVPHPIPTSMEHESAESLPTATPSTTIDALEPAPDETASKKTWRQGVQKVPKFKPDDFQPTRTPPMHIPETAVQGLDDTDQSPQS